jgi:hypothetical protein
VRVRFMLQLVVVLLVAAALAFAAGADAVPTVP